MKEKIPCYYPSSSSCGISTCLYEKVKKNSIERFARYEYMIKNPASKLSVFIFCQVISEKDIEKFIKNFLYKYLIGFRDELNLNWFLKSKFLYEIMNEMDTVLDDNNTLSQKNHAENSRMLTNEEK
ncbi:hypothetical protein M153_9000016196 [Pseudoloma neurophilia]|uniref:Uncharacterized protein n=1 Tax=Pseudoloma neurophilia TaxID=146866 RepID=A0A0R0M7Q1_9MICR|nr:hypothetical protein M153_9000016196 [Pseudoloma neurophilia]